MQKNQVFPLVYLLPYCQTKCRHMVTVWSTGNFKTIVVCSCREVYALPVCVTMLLLAALTVCVFVLAYLPAYSV